MRAASPSSTLGRDAPSTAPSRPRRGLAGQMNAWRERVEAQKAANRPATTEESTASRDRHDRRTTSNRTSSSTATMPQPPQAPTLKVVTRSPHEQSKHTIVSSDNQEPTPTPPSPTLDRASPDDDTTSTSMQSDDEALSPAHAAGTRERQSLAHAMRSSLMDENPESPAMPVSNGGTHACHVDNAVRTQEDAATYQAADVVVAGGLHVSQQINEKLERSTVRQVRFAERVTKFDASYEQAEDEDFPLDLLGAGVEYDAMPSAVTRIEETTPLEEVADEELLLVEQLIGEADALISQNPFDLPNRRNAANLPTSIAATSATDELLQGEDTEQKSDHEMEVLVALTADQEAAERQFAGSSELDELDRLYEERKPQLSLEWIDSSQPRATTSNSAKNDARSRPEEFAASKDDSRAERQTGAAPLSRKSDRTYARMGSIFGLLGLFFVTLWQADLLVTPHLSLDTGRVVGDAALWIKGLGKPAQAAQMLLTHEHRHRLQDVLSTKRSGNEYRSSSVNFHLGWVQEKLQSAFTRIQSRLTTRLESLIDMFIPSNNGINETSINSAKDRFVALQYHQDRLRQRLQEAVKAREQWALGVLEKMRTRRLEFSKATNEVLRETRMVMQNVVQDVELSTRNHIQSRLEQFKASLLSKTQEEQKNHDAVQQEVDAAIALLSEELLRTTVKRDADVKNAEGRLRFAQTSVGIAATEVERTERTMELVVAQLDADTVEGVDELTTERQRIADSMAQEILTAAIDTKKAADDELARIRELEYQAQIEIENVLMDEVIDLLDTQLKAGDEVDAVLDRAEDEIFNVERNSKEAALNEIGEVKEAIRQEMDRLAVEAEQSQTENDQPFDTRPTLTRREEVSRISEGDFLRMFGLSLSFLALATITAFVLRHHGKSLLMPRSKGRHGRISRRHHWQQHALSSDSEPEEVVLLSAGTTESESSEYEPEPEVVELMSPNQEEPPQPSDTLFATESREVSRTPPRRSTRRRNVG